jgi:hypothetical protein
LFFDRDSSGDLALLHDVNFNYLLSLIIDDGDVVDV